MKSRSFTPLAWRSVPQTFCRAFKVGIFVEVTEICALGWDSGDASFRHSDRCPKNHRSVYRTYIICIYLHINIDLQQDRSQNQSSHSDFLIDFCG